MRHLGLPGIISKTMGLWAWAYRSRQGLEHAGEGTMRAFLILVVGCMSVLPLRAYADNGAKRYIVGFQAGVGETQQAEILKAFAMEGVDSIDILNAQVVQAPTGRFKPSMVGLMSNPSVYYVEEDFYTNWLVNTGTSFQSMPMPALDAVMGTLPTLKPNAVGHGEQPWGIVRVGAEKAWPTTTGRGVRVAIIDTGIDFNHPDLQANYKGGYNAIDPKKPPMDDQGHGTHVAGTIAAVKNGEGVVGVAPGSTSSPSRSLIKTEAGV